MCTTLDNASVFQHHDDIGILHGGETMRDDEYRPAMHQPVHAALYNDLGAGINAGGGFIKNHHGWIGDCRPCDGNELALPLRKIAAITGKDSIIAIRQMGDEVVRIGQLGCRNSFFIGGIQSSIADVIHYATGKEVDILQDHA